MANEDEIVSFEAPNATTLALPFPCVNSVRYRPRTQDHLGGLATWEYNHRDQGHGGRGMSLRRHPRAMEPGKVCTPFAILCRLSSVHSTMIILGPNTPHQRKSSRKSRKTSPGSLMYWKKARISLETVAKPWKI